MYICLSSHPSHGEPCSSSSSSSAATVGQPFMWRIKRSTPSYLFGTIHVPYTKVWSSVSSKIKRAFESSDLVMFELDLLDPRTIAALSECQLLPSGSKLQDVLPASLFDRIRRHLEFVRHQIPLWLPGRRIYAEYLFNVITANWERKRPIWIMLMINSLTENDIKSRGSPVLDMFLAQEASRMKKRTGAVEKVEEQCEPLNGLNDNQVIFALDRTMSQHESIRAGLIDPSMTTDDLIDHYICGDLDSALFQQSSPSQLSNKKTFRSFLPPPLNRTNGSSVASPSVSSQLSSAFASSKVMVMSISPTVTPSPLSALHLSSMSDGIDEYFRTELIAKRNQRMSKRIMRLLKRNPDVSFFFAFGAGHFLGDNSIIHYMQKDGFQISRVSNKSSSKNVTSSPSSSSSSSTSSGSNNSLNGQSIVSSTNSTIPISGNIESELAALLKKETKVHSSSRSKSRKSKSSVNVNNIRMISRVQLQPEDEEDEADTQLPSDTQ